MSGDAFKMASKPDSSSSGVEPQLNPLPFFINYYVKSQPDRGKEGYRPWLISKAYALSFAESEASSLFIRLHSKDFTLSNGFNRLNVINFSSAYGRLSSFLSFLSPRQNIELAFDGFEMDLKTAEEVGRGLKEFFSAVPVEKFIHLTINEPDEKAFEMADKVVAKLFDGLRGSDKFSLDITCSSLFVDHLGEVRMGRLKVTDYVEDVNYVAMFQNMKARVVSIPMVPFDVLRDVCIKPNEHLKELVLLMTTGHDKPYYDEYFQKISLAFPYLCEFRLEALFNTVEKKNQLEFLDEMGADCEIMADIEMPFRIMGTFRLFYSDVTDCQNYHAMEKHGFGRRRNGRNNFMICTGTNVFKVNMYDMSQ
ncbi:unnamed protein product [Bursaphelenchus okinawaensis]|uniref:Uncharacterized protein n=1 Tax=Bursaphelenchus okinawaensis TaxID=465554 RepID=A0A811LA43_9BILA|nr:unnamed protein product [Bursaphelenchus okinawaensis]CAG9121896.1 unnamed protein product [Bursaphelenchus okinawaensis]